MAINKNGRIIFEGPSQFDGTPIVVIVTGLTGNSKNAKTGGMLQTWIMRQDIAPHKALKSGDDSSVCGSCPLRAGKGCYVIVFQAPLAVWKCYKRGGYARGLDVSEVAGRAWRSGSYGDPGAVPAGVMEKYARAAASRTGYSHAWQDTPEARGFLMASADTEVEARTAWAQGWRTFRVTDAPIAGEILCPASEEAGRRTTCEDCGLCAGADKQAKSIYIPAHGTLAAAARESIANKGAK